MSQDLEDATLYASYFMGQKKQMFIVLAMLFVMIKLYKNEQMEQVWGTCDNTFDFSCVINVMFSYLCLSKIK